MIESLVPGDALADAFDRVASPAAHAVVDVDRDETEGFRIRLRGLAAGGLPPRDDLLPLVPPGSRWSDAVGWVSLVAVPLATSVGAWWSLTLVTVLARSGGGAVPRARTYLHPIDPVVAHADRLDALAAALDPAREGARAEAVTTPVWVGSLPGTRSEASRAEQADLVRVAAAACRVGRRPALRTIALTEAELAPWIAWSPRLPPGVDCAIVGVADALARHHSLGTSLLLAWRTFWRPY